MKIIGISGKKQSGKNTVANYINGDILQQRKMINSFYIDENGKLIVETQDSNNQTGFGEFDVTRKDETFTDYAEHNLWPYIKIYHFADPLKEMCVDLFDLRVSDVYGSNEDKNKLTDLLWENMPNNTDNRVGPLTNREFLEHFGTSIVRKIKNDAWSNFTIKHVLQQNSEIAIIPDVRFPNEVLAIKNNGGFVIRLTRDIFKSSFEAETALDRDNFDWSQFDLVIDNDNITLKELCSYLDKQHNLWRN